MNEEYLEIDLMELMRSVFSKWWLIVITVSICAGLSFYITKTQVIPVYEASSTIFIGKDTSSLGGLNLSMDDMSVDTQLVTDYQELVKTRLITQRVINELALETDSEDLIKSLDVSVIKDSRFMHLTYQDPDAKVAVNIANKFANILKEKAGDVVGIKNVQIVDYAEYPDLPAGPSMVKNVGIAGAVGFILSLIMIVANMLMTNSIQKEEDIEKMLGIPVLGVIPQFKGVARNEK